MGDSEAYRKQTAMTPGDGIRINSTSPHARAHHLLRKELAAIDAVALDLSRHLPSLYSLEVNIVQHSKPLEKPVFKYTCTLNLDDEGHKITVGTLSLEENIAKLLFACSDAE
jgi:hypothetical protein